MTLTEFLDELAKTKKRGWKWYYDGVLRGTPVKNVPPSFCPLTAVHYEKTRIPYGIVEWSIAAKALGIAVPMASRIVEAADDTGAPILRRRMMAKLGLKEKP